MALSTLTTDELFQQYTTKAQVDEAGRFKTVPKGSYTFRAESYEPRLGDKPTYEGSDRPNPMFERRFAHVFFRLEDKDGNKKGSIYLDLSWECKRITEGQNTGELDKPSKHWGQIVKALKMESESVGAVLEALKQYPVVGYITEYWVRGEGESREFGDAPKNDEERAALLEAGYEPRNAVQNFSRVK